MSSIHRLKMPYVQRTMILRTFPVPNRMAAQRNTLNIKRTDHTRGRWMQPPQPTAGQDSPRL